MSIEQVKNNINRLWELDISRLSYWKRVFVQAARILYVIVHDLADGQLTLRAMSLVYTTLLSMVPLLAVSFSVLKAFGVHTQVEPLLLKLLTPLGEKSVEITQTITGFVDNMKVGVLGSLGLALLFYTVVSLIQKIERAFNYTWRVKQHRRLSQRFSDYLSVVMIGPVLIFSAIGITAAISNASAVQALTQIEPFGEVIHMVGKLVPYLLIIAAFTFIYVLIPNTPVQLKSAFVGALVSGVLWESVGWGFATLVAGSTQYTAIYSSFAILVMFMIWLYLAWLILLIGASIAYYHQHPECLRVGRDVRLLSNRVKERLSVIVMVLIGRRFYSGEDGYSTGALARQLNLPHDVLRENVGALRDAKILVATAQLPAKWVPGKPLDKLTVGEVVQVIRKADEVLGLDSVAADAGLRALLRSAEDAHTQVLSSKTIKQLVEDEDA